MFRASLRPVSDPIRDNICFFCLSQTLRGRSRLHRLYGTTPYRLSQGGGDEAADKPPRPTDSSVNVPSSNQESELKPESSPEVPPAPDDNQSVSKPPKFNNHHIHKSRFVHKKLKNNAPAFRSDKTGDENAGKNIDSSRDEVEKKPGGPPQKHNVENNENKRFRKKPKRPVAKPKARVRSKTPKAKRNASPPGKAPNSRPPAPTHLPRNPMDPGTLEEYNLPEADSGIFNGNDIGLTPLDVERPPVPRLSFGLDRVLFNPGVYHLRDPRSRVFNFDPYLGTIMPVTEFDFTALKDYITSSRDKTLRNVAAKEQKKYIGSSSSMTSVLSQFHYLLSAWRPVNARSLSQGFPDKLRTFTKLSRAPAAIILRYQDGVYAIDADKEFDSANILMNLGKSMEKLLTLPKEEFERYGRSSENKITPEEEQATPESYHYTTSGDFIMRSQLDAYDPRLPGTGMFDLKTRAAVSIRMDAQNFEHGLGYEIRDRYGNFESFEREFFDMIRAAFLKYSLQVRIGRMDGIFVAFHNIRRIFGFQYISLPEMDFALHNQADTILGDTEFKISLALWNKVLNRATAKFPERSLRLHFETREASVPFMYIFAEPVTEEEIEAIQTNNKAEIDAYQRRILNLAPKEQESDLAAAAATDNSEAQASESTSEPAQTAPSTEDSTKSDAKDDGAASSSPPEEQQQQQQQQQQQSSSGETETETENEPPQDSQEEQPPRELLGMTLFIRNKLNGRFVERPEQLKPTDDWKVEYELKELPRSRITQAYIACKKRRQKSLEGRGEDDSAASGYVKKLRALSKQGEEFRKEEDRIDRERGIVVLGDPV